MAGAHDQGVVAHEFSRHAHESLAIGVMAKAPVAGFAKTRLIPLLGEIGAAKLQASLIEQTLVYFSVYTLDFLYWGGRLERMPRPDSSSAEDRPILRLKDGRLSLVERVIGETTRVQRMAELVEERHGPDEPLVAVCVHAGPRGEDAARKLEQRMRTTPNGAETIWLRAPLGPALCAHTGFDVCGIAAYPRSMSRLERPPAD